MIPYQNEQGELSRGRMPETTFCLDEDSQTVRGLTRGQTAARQAARLILNTERYRHAIYSFGYGTELEELRGRSDSFLFPEIKRRVTEALLADDRMTGTSDFTFRRAGSRVEARFTVHTIHGDLEMERTL